MLKGEKLYLKNAFPKKCESLSLSPKSLCGESKNNFDGKFFNRDSNIFFGGEGSGIFIILEKIFNSILSKGKQVKVKHKSASEISSLKNVLLFENNESTFSKSFLMFLNSSDTM